MESVSVADAKRRFSELLDRAGRGERFLILRHGRPAVAMVPPREASDDAPGLPYGFASLAGALADWEELEEEVEEIYRSRLTAVERPSPDFE